MAVCLGLICLTHVRPASTSHLANSVRQSAPTSNDSISEVNDQQPALPTDVPEWESRFWEIANEPQWIQSQEELEALADAVPEEQLQAVLDEFSGDQFSGDQSTAGLIFVRRLIARWAEKSPQEAARWVAGLADDNFGHEACRQLMVSWAKGDLSNALAWIRQQPESGSKAAGELSLAKDAAEENQGAIAISLLAALPSSQERDNLLNYSVRQWAVTDRSDAIAWIEQVQDSTLREQMLENVVTDWAVQDPSSAAGFATTTLDAGNGRDNVIVNIVRLWATSAPDQAASWVGEFPEGELRTLAMQNLVDVWERIDPNATSAWVKAAQNENGI